MRNGRQNETPIVLKTDKATIKEMIDRRSEQESIFAVQSLFVVGVAPRLAVARHKVRGIFDSCDARSALDPCHAIAE